MMIWLFRTGCAWGNKGRGVLGCGNFRMKFRDSSQEFFVATYSSQGTPHRTIRNEFDVRRKQRHNTGSSSIRSFYFSIFTQVRDIWRESCQMIVLGLSCAAIILATAKVSADGETLRAPPSVAAPARDPIEAAGDDFEGMMLQLLYNQMVQGNRILSQGEDNPFAPSHAEMVFKSMQDQAMMQQLAQSRPLGVGSLVARQLRGETGVGASHLVDSRHGLKKQIGPQPESEK
jgi:hypothetical protein